MSLKKVNHHSKKKNGNFHQGKYFRSDFWQFQKWHRSQRLEGSVWFNMAEIDHCCCLYSGSGGIYGHVYICQLWDTRICWTLSDHNKSIFVISLWSSESTFLHKIFNIQLKIHLFWFFRLVCMVLFCVEFKISGFGTGLYHLWSVISKFCLNTWLCIQYVLYKKAKKDCR